MARAAKLAARGARCRVSTVRGSKSECADKNAPMTMENGEGCGDETRA